MVLPNPPPQKSVLTVENLSVHYGSAVALDTVSMHIRPGEIVGLIGPNGAGKTSFIKALCGRTHATGHIKINDIDLKRGQTRQNLIGLVPQDIGLYAHMTAQENLTVFAKIMNIPRAKRKKRILAALRAVGMTTKTHARADTLSGGMKRRINVAAAIMHQPKLLILDEPTAGVDVPARDTIHKLARLLANTGMGILLVTHELDQAEALCDKILLLAKGKKLGFATPPQLLSQCFGTSREVKVKFSIQPNLNTINALHPFGFKEGELPTIWTTMTQISEVSFVSAFMAAVENGDQHIREISVGRPGLASLMYRLEKDGDLPQLTHTC